MGFETVILPLSKTEPLPVSDNVADCDAVVVTSVNALRHAPRELMAQLSTKPCFAVGARTAAAARDAGFVDVVQADGDAESLIDTIIGANVSGKVAYLAGRVRMPDFEIALQKAGVSVAAIEVYDTVAVEPSEQEIATLKAGRPIDAVLIYSANAAEAVQKLAKRPEMAETFSKTAHCCLSRRIAARLEGRDSLLIRIADQPDEDALFALLEA